MNSRSLSVFRWTALCVAALLAAQCIWLLLAQMSRSNVTNLPTDAHAATAAAKQRGGVTWAAASGIIRGNSWVQAGFTYSDLLWGRNGAGANGATGTTRQDRAQAQAILDQAIREAPCDSGAWLLVAGLASRYPLDHRDATAALKMSYYTGPSEPGLIPSRFRFAIQSGRSNDPEMQQFIGRDLRFLLSDNQTKVVVAAYKIAAPSEREFIEQTVSQLSPDTLASLRAANPSPGPPD
ncbi:MAG TPA: hypothetical protein VGH13_20135 [Xanthobacteraceae bacterium]|jgi:hypothetical protein